MFVERQGLVIFGIVLVCGGVAVGLQVQSGTDDEAHADRGEQERVRQNCRPNEDLDRDLFASVVMPRLPQNIWVAAADADLPRVQQLVELDAIDPNQPDDNSYTPMSVPTSYPDLADSSQARCRVLFPAPCSALSHLQG